MATVMWLWVFYRAKEDAIWVLVRVEMGQPRTATTPPPRQHFCAAAVATHLLLTHTAATTHL